MANSNSRLFTYAKNLSGIPSAPTPVRIKIANSTTVKVGQMARVNTSGFIVPAGVGNAILGRISGIVDANSVPVNAFQYDASRTGQTNIGDDSVTTASDNQTRANAVYAEVEVGTEPILFRNYATAALLQTNLMQLFDLVSTSDQIDQGTAGDTTGQMQLIEIDPEDSTLGLFRVAEPQLLGHNAGTVAINAA